MNRKRVLSVVLSLVVLGLIGLGVLMLGDGGDVSISKAEAMTPEAKAAQIEHGRYLAVAGDCVACHTREGGEPFAGGLAMITPFGTIHTPNITPDKETGLGNWTPTDFYRAMHVGKDPKKNNLYPAFSYPYYTKVSRKDAEAIGAYLLSLEPVKYTPPANKMTFPFNIRFLVKGWNLLNLRTGQYEAVQGKSAQWNRGAYLVEGLGHCGACHTPKNVIFGDKNNQAFEGGVVEHWFASDLTSDPKTGLGKWSEDDIVQFLKTGGNVHSIAYGTMVDVVKHSTSQMTDSDLKAIAIYLKSIPAPAPRPASPKPDAAVMAAGKTIYDKQCVDCHIDDGTGVPELYTPLAGNANVNVSDPTSIIHILLAGQENEFGGEGMPAFAKLADKDIAALATYIRNSFGNNAPEVTVKEVTKLREHVKPKQTAAAAPVAETVVTPPIE